MATITETVRRPQVRQTQCFIGGKWIPAASGKTFETIHPATEEVICEVAEGDKEESMRRSTRPAMRSTTANGRRWTLAIVVADPQAGGSHRRRS